MQLDVIVIGQDDVGQGERYVRRRQIFLFARGERHGCARVDKNVSEQVDFLAKDFNIKTVGTSIETPSEVAEIIAGRVFAIVGKLQTGAAPRRGVAACMAPKKFLSRAESQGFELV